MKNLLKIIPVFSLPVLFIPAAAAADPPQLPGRTPQPGPVATLEARRAFWRSCNPVKVIQGFTIRDVNNDGWDDGWLMANQWPPGGDSPSRIEGAPDADFDGDGVSNHQEMLSNTCPCRR